MNDFSFIRLLPTLREAIFSEVSQASTLLNNYQQIVLSPKSFYLQKTNILGNGIAFDNNVEVTLVDLCDTFVKDITENVAITEVIDINGLPQIYFEILNINTDYYGKPLSIKFKKTTSNQVWYSNPILVTDYFKKTQFLYKNVGDLYWSSIDLACYFSTFNALGTSESYTTFDGIKRTSRLINTEFRKYIFEYCSNFCYRRLNFLLSSNFIYADNFLVTDKQILESNDRFGDTDNFELEFSLATDFTQSKVKELQIFEPFEYSSFNPIQQNSLPITELVGTLNKEFTLQSGTIELYRDNELIATFVETGVVVSGLEFTITTDLIDSEGIYAVRISEGLFKSVSNENSPIVTDWNFQIVDGYYNQDFYNNNFYLTS